MPKNDIGLSINPANVILRVGEAREENEKERNRPGYIGNGQIHRAQMDSSTNFLSLEQIS
jgi:hypothetical protein